MIQMVRSCVALFTFATIWFGLASVWESLLHLQHTDSDFVPMWLRVLVPLAVFPIIQGFISALILRPVYWIEYWPIAVAPIVTLGVRAVLDDVTPSWLESSIPGLMLGVILTAFLALVGGLLADKLERLPSLQSQGSAPRKGAESL